MFHILLLPKYLVFVPYFIAYKYLKKHVLSFKKLKERMIFIIFGIFFPRNIDKKDF